MSRECNNLDAYLAGDLPVDEVACFENHLDACDECRGATQQQRWIDSMLQSQVRTQLEPLPAKLLANARKSTSPRHINLQLAACGLATAATLLLAFGLWHLNQQTIDKLGQNANPPDVAQIAPSQNPSLRPATFIGNADMIAVPIESRHPDVTIVRIYPTYQPPQNYTAAANTDTSTKLNWYEYSYGG